MAIRAPRWGWNRARWSMAALTLLWAGHGVWVFLGPDPGRHWTSLAGAVSRPSQGLASRWRDWRASRRAAAREFEEIRADHARLSAELAELKAQAARDAPRLQESDEAVRLLGLKRQLPLDLKAARVLFSTRPAAFGGLILDRGRDLGLVEDQGVMAPEGVVGRLWSVSATQAKVLPVDAPNASVSVMLARSRATGVLQGLGLGRAIIRYIGKQEVVQVGEAVLTSGLDRVFPRGLLVGYVAEVAQGDLELRLIVNLSAPLDRLNTVLLLPPQPPLEVQPPFLAPEPAPPGPRGKP